MTRGCGSERSLLALLLCPILVAATDYQVAGLTGVLAIANGQYSSSDMMANGYPCYVNAANVEVAGSEIVLCIDANGYWAIQPVADAGTTNAWMHSSGRYMPFPEQAAPWLTHYTDAWTVNKEVTVSVVPLPDQALVKKTVAVMLFGGLVAAAVILSCVKSSDKHLRSQSYWLVGATISGVVSLLFGKVLLMTCFGMLLPHIFASTSLSLDMVNVLASFAIFVLGFMALNFFGWKLQDSDSYLALVNFLAAHVVAVAGALFFYYVLVVTTTNLAPAFTGLSSHPRVQTLIAGLFTLGCAWTVFALFSWASIGARHERYDRPPVYPWATRKSPLVGDRTCMSFGNKPAEVQGMDWKEVVQDAEDEVASIDLGALLILVLNIAVTGTALPAGIGLTTKQLQHWWIIIAVLSVLNIVFFCVRSRVDPGGRATIRAQRTICMATSFAVLEMFLWLVGRNFRESAPLALVAQASAVALAAFALLWVVDKILDNTMGRRAGSGFRKLWGKLYSTDDTMTPAEKAATVLTSALGMLVAFVFARALIPSVGTLLQDYVPGFEAPDIQETVRFRLAASLALLVVALLFLRVYLVAVLPKARLSEEEHEKAISQEADQLIKVI